jgi:uncharacterized protein YbjT (DUF2867 family)
LTPGTGSQQYEGNRSQWRFVVKVLVIGGTGLIGSKVVVDVAAAVARTAVGDILEVARPDRYPLDDLSRTRLRASNDSRRVVTDPQARYFGMVLDDKTLVPATTATVLPTRLEDWPIDNAPAPVR